jgi:hypothetical protein
MLVVYTNVVWVYHLSIYTHQVYYLTCFIFSMYFNQMHIQRYINLEKYSHFITLDIYFKYPYLKPNMFSNLKKFCLNKSHLNFKIDVVGICDDCARC